MNQIHVKTGDTVVMLSGKDKGKQGKVLQVSPKEQKVIVEGLNMVTKHVKPRKQGDPGWYYEGGIRCIRLQSNGCLPQVRQGDPPGP